MTLSKKQRLSLGRIKSAPEWADEVGEPWDMTSETRSDLADQVRARDEAIVELCRLAVCEGSMHARNIHSGDCLAIQAWLAPLLQPQEPQNARDAAMLEKYGSHTAECGVFSGAPPRPLRDPRCTCGLKELVGG